MNDPRAGWLRIEMSESELSRAKERVALLEAALRRIRDADGDAYYVSGYAQGMAREVLGDE